MRIVSPDEFRERLDLTLMQIREKILEKNVAYGNSLTNPVRIFSKAPLDEAIRVRIDDKLSRLARGDEAAFGEIPTDDVIGYLVVLKMMTDAGQTITEGN